jgi:hypothetical protein
MNISLCTLFERNYHYGVAALSNSLVSAGFAGSLWVGYRGALPAWIVDSPEFDPVKARLQVTPAFSLNMVAVDTPLHFVYYKAQFLRRVVEEFAPETDVVAYLDPDIVLKCNWPSFTGWFTEDGISLVEDVNWSFPARHPKRLQWNTFFADHGLYPCRELERYYNSGFIVVSRKNLGFLDLWSKTCELVMKHNAGTEEQVKAGTAADLFYSTDQDALNAALAMSDIPLNTAGMEAMDFSPGGYYLSHAIGSNKPWLGNHLRQALRGFPPSAACKAYLHFAEGPIKAHPEGYLRWQRFWVRVASAIGRFYRRA